MLNRLLNTEVCCIHLRCVEYIACGNNTNNNDQTVEEIDDVPSASQQQHLDRRSRYRKTNKNKQSQQIILQRISQRVKKASGGFFWSGHMFYYTNTNTEVMCFFSFVRLLETLFKECIKVIKLTIFSKVSK